MNRAAVKPNAKPISQSPDNYRNARNGANERIFSLLYGKN